MSGTMSKRAAARNEKALQELVHSVTGNNLCADCAARNPAWASWSLGIFLCMRCAAIHRKLGTHVSKVKSLSMDSWSNEQVDNMRKVGNVASNKIYNPQNKKPPVPIDADEADSAMERFIRAKYMGNGLKKPKRNSTGSIVSEEGTPPPLPPKNTSKFGLRSASSFLSLSGRKKDKSSNPPSRDGATSPRPSTGSLSPRRNKPSKVFGAAVDYGVGEDMEQKLRKLKDMGFTDEQRNQLVLNGMHGNMEKTVEALVRLGEGSTPTEPKPPRALTPTPITSTGGLSLNPASPLYDARPASASTNPFDNIKPAPPPPQSSQSTGTMPNSTNPFLQPQTQSMNPFGVPTQQDPDLIAQAFSGMSLAPQQVLFPHHTGPIPPQQTTAQPYQQSMTPPVYSTANFAAMSFNSTQTYPPPSQPVQPQNTGYNPFLQNASPKANPLAVQTAGVQNTFGNNPFTRSPTRLQSPSPLAQIPETIQQNIYYTPQPAPPQQSPSTNPFLHTPMSAPLQMPNPYHQQQPQHQPQPQGQPQIQQQQQLYQQQIQQPQNPFQQQNVFGQQQQYQQPVAQPPKADKASIMALFNYPQLAPQQPAEAGTGMNGQGDLLGLGGQPAAQGTPQTSAPQRSVSTPLAGSNNPFHNMTSGASAAIPDPSASTSSKSSVPRSEEKIPGIEPMTDIGSMPGIGASLNAGVGLMRGVGGSMGHGGGMGVGGMAGVGGPKRQSAMRDSVSLGMDMGWANGRHSPDAFASLSARAGR